MFPQPSPAYSFCGESKARVPILEMARGGAAVRHRELRTRRAAGWTAGESVDRVGDAGPILFTWVGEFVELKLSRRGAKKAASSRSRSFSDEGPGGGG